MPLPRVLAVFAFLFSVSTLAQAQMHMEGGQMGGPMMGQSSPQKVEDGRQVIPLTEAETAVVMAEMRQMLASIQGIVDGLARQDRQAVVAAASKSGMGMMRGVSPQIRMKFPPTFRQMGMASHAAFDRIAAETESVKDPAPVLNLLSEGMQNCIACHATYRFAPPR
jgi:hypothetical protein